MLLPSVLVLLQLALIAMVVVKLVEMDAALVVLAVLRRRM